MSMTDKERIHRILIGLISEMDVFSHVNEDCEFCKITVMLQKESKLQEILNIYMLNIVKGGDAISTFGNCIVLGFVIGQRFAESKVLENLESLK